MPTRADSFRALVAADDQLRAASGIDEGEDDDVSKLRTPPPPRQPRSPTPPAHLPRVDHPIEVPAAQRACPKCGADRACVEPHVTEVIELVPPQVIVRRDIHEQLACAECEGAPVRAPAGETVVPNGKLGLGLGRLDPGREVPRRPTAAPPARSLSPAGPRPRGVHARRSGEVVHGPTVDAVEKIARGLNVLLAELFVVHEQGERRCARARELIDEASDVAIEKVVRLLEAVLH